MTFEIEFNERNSKYSDRFQFPTRVSKNTYVHIQNSFEIHSHKVYSSHHKLSLKQKKTKS